MSKEEAKEEVLGVMNVYPPPLGLGMTHAARAFADLGWDAGKRTHVITVKRVDGKVTVEVEVME